MAGAFGIAIIGIIMAVLLHGLNILLALEVDYIPGITLSIHHYRKNYPFDYIIGSVHLVKNEASGKLWFIDGPDIKVYDNGLKEDIFWRMIPGT